jgi:signal transduction histidine kinase
LLELSRLEQLEELKREHVDLEDVVQDSIGTLSPLAMSKNVALVMSNCQGCVVVEGNSVLLSRAVGNLLDNAIKYSPSGGTVQVSLEENNDGQALVSVIDHGPGIRATDLPRVFEKFYRARVELDEVPGTGLGLSIVKTIIEQHGGQIWAESTVDTGSVFTMALPALQNGNEAGSTG